MLLVPRTQYPRFRAAPPLPCPAGPADAPPPPGCACAVPAAAVVLALLALAAALPAAAATGAAPPAGRLLVWCEPGAARAGLAAASPALVVHAGPADLVEVDAARLPAGLCSRIADPQPWSAPTYLVTGPARLLEPLPAGTAHLGRGPGAWYLVRGARAAVETLARRGMSLVALDPRDARPRPASGEPARVPRAAAASPPARVADPNILPIVMQVSTAELTATVQRLQDFVTRYSTTDSSLAAADYLAGRFSAMGLEVTLDGFDLQGHWIHNVVATQTGTETPDRIFIICGHFDSTSEAVPGEAPGADDNASGSAGVVEAARVLSGHDFRSTIQYICFSGEEQGLVGSHHYVDDVVVPMGLDVEGVINLDMIAFVHPDYPDWDANVYADQQLSLWLGQHLARCINDYSVAMDVLVETDGPIWGSDHFWFANTGYPAVFGIDAQLWGAPDWDPYYHTTQDRIETLDLAYHTEFVRGAAAAVAELAELAELVPQIGIADAGPAAPAVPLVRIAPNPFAAQVLFDAGRSGGPLSIAISDASGRVVARLAGGERLRWDGRDAGGRRLAAGIYFYRVIEPAGARGGRVVLLR